MMDGITLDCRCISANARRFIENALADRISARVDLMGVLEDERVPSPVIAYIEDELRDLNETLTQIRGLTDC